MHMVRTAQINCTRADTKATVNTMKATRKETHDTAMWQHNTLLLVFSVAWTGNDIVKTLGNFHSPFIIKGGVQRWCRINGANKSNPVGMPVLEQGKDYC